MKKVYILLYVLLVLTIAGGFLYFFDRLQSVESRLDESASAVVNNSTHENVSTTEDILNDTCSDKCKNEIEKAVGNALALITPTVKTVVSSPITTTVKTGGTTYIPMGTTYTTTSTEWYTINDTAVYIDLANDYGKSATVSWEASLKVAHGNGQAFARLWDDTNKIAVNGSELATINNVTYSLVSTGNLPFWKGRNLYKLQIKSLNSFEVAVTGAKIKVEY